MLLLRHRFELARCGVQLVQQDLRGEDLRVARVRVEGGGYDEALERVCGDRAAEWSTVRVVLSGPVLSTAARPVELGAGDAFAIRRSFGATLRSLTPVTDWIDLHWRAGGRFGTRVLADGAIRLGPAQRGAAAALATALASGDAARASGLAAELAGALRAEGVPLEQATARDLAEVVSPAEQSFARALEGALAALGSQPMAIDLARALGVSERQALRRASGYFRRFHFSVSSWREYLAGMRIAVGMAFMGSPRATTDAVSRALGFASPTGLCHAFQDAGLPSPLSLQRRLAT